MGARNPEPGSNCGDHARESRELPHSARCMVFPLLTGGVRRTISTRYLALTTRMHFSLHVAPLSTNAILEGCGLDPHIPMSVSKSITGAKRDRVIEGA